MSSLISRGLPCFPFNFAVLCPSPNLEIRHLIKPGRWNTITLAPLLALIRYQASSLPLSPPLVFVLQYNYSMMLLSFLYCHSPSHKDDPGYCSNFDHFLNSARVTEQHFHVSLFLAGVMSFLVFYFCEVFELIVPGLGLILTWQPLMLSEWY